MKTIGDDVPVEEVALVELKIVEDTFATGCGRVEIIGDTIARFWMYVDQRSPTGDHERLVVAKITMPIECVPEAIRVSSAGITKRAQPNSFLEKEMLLCRTKVPH